MIIIIYMSCQKYMYRIIIINMSCQKYMYMIIIICMSWQKYVYYKKFQMCFFFLFGLVLTFRLINNTESIDYTDNNSRGIYFSFVSIVVKSSNIIRCLVITDYNCTYVFFFLTNSSFYCFSRFVQCLCDLN